MKQYKLKYTTEIDAIADLISRGIINEDKSFGANTVALVWTGKVIKTKGVYNEEGVETTPPTFEEGYFVDAILKGTHIFTNTEEITGQVFGGFVEPEEQDKLQALNERIAVGSKVTTPIFNLYFFL